MKNKDVNVILLLLSLVIVLVIGNFSCRTTKVDKRVTENLSIKPYYRNKSTIYIKPDSVVGKIIRSRRSEAGPVYMVMYKDSKGRQYKEEIMEFEIHQ